MKRTILLLFTAALLLPVLLNAQAQRWKRTRYEIVGGVGVTGFMGDLGGGAGASHFIGDFDFTSQRPLLSAGIRYKILEPLAVKPTISYGWVSGADSKSKDKYRLDRNLSFYSPIIELAAQLEYSIIQEPTTHRYNLRRGSKFSWRMLKMNTYIFAGIGGFYFNPKAKDQGPDGTGKFVALQPLGTEGQGLVEGREKYSRVQVSFPLGVGVKYNLSRRIGVGIEIGARYTLTDYIDDVSTSYIDNSWLAKVNPQAARMADPSLWSPNPSDTKPGIPYGAGDQRGESKYNDFYIFNQITIAYKLTTGRNGLPKF